MNPALPRFIAIGSCPITSDIIPDLSCIGSVGSSGSTSTIWPLGTAGNAWFAQEVDHERHEGQMRATYEELHANGVGWKVNLSTSIWTNAPSAESTLALCTVPASSHSWRQTYIPPMALQPGDRPRKTEPAGPTFVLRRLRLNESRRLRRSSFSPCPLVRMS